MFRAQAAYAQFREVAAIKSRFQADVARLFAMPEVQALSQAKQKNLLAAAVLDMTRELAALCQRGAAAGRSDKLAGGSAGGAPAPGTPVTSALAASVTQRGDAKEPEPEPEQRQPPEATGREVVERHFDRARTQLSELPECEQTRRSLGPLIGPAQADKARVRLGDILAGVPKMRAAAPSEDDGRSPNFLPGSRAVGGGELQIGAESLHRRRRRATQTSPERVYAAPPGAPANRLVADLV